MRGSIPYVLIVIFIAIAIWFALGNPLHGLN